MAANARQVGSCNRALAQGLCHGVYVSKPLKGRGVVQTSGSSSSIPPFPPPNLMPRRWPAPTTATTVRAGPPGGAAPQSCRRPARVQGASKCGGTYAAGCCNRRDWGVVGVGSTRVARRAGAASEQRSARRSACPLAPSTWGALRLSPFQNGPQPPPARRSASTFQCRPRSERYWAACDKGSRGRVGPRRRRQRQLQHVCRYSSA
mgnify:CR=1 FL=1